MKNNWQIKKLKEVCERVQNVNPEQEFEVSFSYVDISSVCKGRGIVEHKIYNIHEAPSRARRPLKEGDTLFALTRPYLQNIAFVTKDYNNAVASTGFSVLRPKQEILNPFYLFYFISSDEFLSKILPFQTGATYPAVAESRVMLQEIALPPLKTQKEIVAKLNEKFAKLREAKKLREEALVDTEKILSQTLHEIFEEGKQKGWEEATIGGTCSLMTGATPSTSRKDYYGGDIKWLVSGDIHNKEIFDCEGRINELGVKNSNAKLLPKNSLLIALNGQGKTKGTVSILRVEATCNQSLVAIIPSNKVLVEYLYYCLHFQYKKIRGMAGNDSRKGLNMKLVREITFILPTLKEQQKIIKRLDDLDIKVRKAIELQKSQLQDLKKLEKSYLREAFNGELI
jgi:type I restriction enzyme S subunit